ncbi:MAG: MFS transporter [Christensenellaceae bacterium]|nr:MFS transporter [Christensenellaceae bacterium]
MYTLDKKWKEFVFAASSFGPNILMVLLMAYFTDAVYPIGLTADKANWSITGYTLIYAPIFGLIWSLGRAFDGIIDIPLASLTDNMRTKWGRRRPPIAVALLPMIVTYILAWIPLEYKSDSVINTVWMVGMLIIFYAAYTMCLVAFYGSISHVCGSEEQRARVSGYKSFFDTIGFVFVYALLPIFISKGINIRTISLISAPLMLTMTIPLFMIKEGEKYGEDIEKSKSEKLPMVKSFLMCCKNKSFLWWVLTYACAFFGLQMFLSAQNTLISGVMNLSAGYAAILNACAFAPVPLMLLLMYRFIKKRGIRFTYRLSLILFSIAILNFNLGSEYLWPNNELIRVIIGCIGSILGSFSIGTFFAVPCMIPSQIAAVEKKLTGKDHTSMYFAAQSLFVAVIGAVSTGIVYEYLKGFTAPKVIAGLEIAGQTWKTGVSFVPIVVTIFCLIGFFICGKMPAHYTEEVVKKSLNEIK